MATSLSKTKTQQEVCIDLPGDQVKCWRSSDRITVTLRKHRDIFFDISLEKDVTYTVESNDNFYCPRAKKLLRKAAFQDGERAHFWVGREFKGSLLLKKGLHTLGSYEPNRLDPKLYGMDARIKPEPLMIIMGQRDALGSLMCTAQDPFGIGSTQQLLKTSMDTKLSMLIKFGTEFDYTYPPEPPEVKEYVAVTEAAPHEIQSNIRIRLDNGEAIQGDVETIFVISRKDQPPSTLYQAIGLAAAHISGSELWTSNSLKETAGYIYENRKSLNKISMHVHIEKRAKGKYKVALRGRPITSLVGKVLGVATNARPVHEKIALGSKGSAYIDGGFARSGKAGYGGAKRLILTTAKNFGSGMKIQVVGTVIDIIIDANTVFFDEAGSKDLTEFLGRAGVSIAKAGATAAIGSLIAAGAVAFLTAIAGVGVLPVIAVVGVVVAGYILAATIVDWADNKLDVKNGVAKWAK